MNLSKLIAVLVIAMALPGAAEAAGTGAAQKSLDRSSDLSIGADSSLKEGRFAAGRTQARDAFEAAAIVSPHSSRVVHAGGAKTAPPVKSAAFTSTAGKLAASNHSMVPSPNRHKTAKKTSAKAKPYPELALGLLGGFMFFAIWAAGGWATVGAVGGIILGVLIAAQHYL